MEDPIDDFISILGGLSLVAMFVITGMLIWDPCISTLKVLGIDVLIFLFCVICTRSPKKNKN